MAEKVGKDKRDLRDPKVLGEKLLEESDGILSLSYFYPQVELDYVIPDYQGNLLGFYTAEEYAQEMLEKEERVLDRPFGYPQ